MMVCKNNAFLIIIIMATIAVAFFSMGLGKYSLPPDKIIHIILSGHTYTENSLFNLIEHQVIWNIRMPRILTALLAGGGLALCGAALQGVFYNPLVDPHIIGVTSGAAFGGTLAILFSLSPVFLMLSAFSFGLLALLIVYFIAGLLKQRGNLVLVLAGVILSGFFSALVSMLQYMADTEEKLPSIVFWLMGSFATAKWSKLLIFAIPVVSASFILLRLRWRINVLSLGDKDAKAMGMSVHFTRWLILIMTAVITASQVAVSGSVGWIGLVIPHLARMFTGVDHRKLLPAAMVLGGCFMIIVDDIARLLTSAEIPIGIITALLGAPIFTTLLVRDMKRNRE